MSKKSLNCFLIFRWIFVGYLATVTFPIHAFLFSKSPTPNSVHIKLDEARIVADFKFEIRETFPYWFSMSFGYPESDPVERARVRKLLGGFALDKLGKPVEPGTPTPIILTVSAICNDATEVVIYSQDTDPILTSWGDGYFGKNIGTHILTPGMYRARLLNKIAAPDFSSVPITFVIWKSAKMMFDPEKAAKRRKPCHQ